MAALPGWQFWGKQLRGAADAVLNLHPEVTDLVESIRAASGISSDREAEVKLEAAAARLRLELASRLGIAASTAEEIGPTGHRHQLVRALTAAAGDPDVDVATWLAGETPIGIKEPVIPRGVFPQALPSAAKLESMVFYQRLRTSGNRIAGNYASFSENQGLATQELERLVAAGHLEPIGTWAEVVERWPSAMSTKIAAIVKDKPDGSTKTRLVVDMRRSGVNGLVTIHERIALPRAVDVVQDALELLDSPGGHAEVEFLVVDFKDAFLTLRLAHEERAYTIVNDGQRFLAYRSLPFGLGSAPLVWGRVAAWLSRLAQSTMDPWTEGRLQVYVDDPCFTLRGRCAQRTSTAARVLLLWAALGFQLAWRKAKLGSEVCWIGVQFRALPDGVTLFFDSGRVARLKKDVQTALASRGLVLHLRHLAGELSWMAGIVPRIRPFVSHLWAALAEADQAKATGARRLRPKDSVFLRQVSHALRWLLSFLSSEEGGISRKRLVEDLRAPLTHLVRTDASTSGMGGILLDGGNNPVAFWADEISDTGRRRFHARAGESAFMPEFELLAILISLKAFEPELRGKRSGFAVQADSQSALGAALKLSSPRPLMNALAAEIALQLERLHSDVLLTEHFPGTLNIEADALSRLTEGKSVPTRLLPVARREAPLRDGGFFLAWPWELE